MGRDQLADMPGMPRIEARRRLPPAVHPAHPVQLAPRCAQALRPTNWPQRDMQMLHLRNFYSVPATMEYRHQDRVIAEVFSLTDSNYLGEYLPLDAPTQMAVLGGSKAGRTTQTPPTVRTMSACSSQESAVSGSPQTSAGGPGVHGDGIDHRASLRSTSASTCRRTTWGLRRRSAC